MAKKKEKPDFEVLLRKLGRFCAWALIVLILLYFVSGYGITKSGMIYRLTGGLMDRGAALWLHNILTLPMAFAFLCHTLISIRFAMIRWNVRNKTGLNWVFLGIGAVLFGLACYAYFA
jgi:hypothetical protein